MRRRIEIEDEPGASTHSGADPQRLVLPSDEGFEVIVNDGLRKGTGVSQDAAVEQKGVPAQPFGAARDRGLGAAQRPGKLPMGGASR